MKKTYIPVTVTLNESQDSTRAKRECAEWARGTKITLRDEADLGRYEQAAN